MTLIPAGKGACSLARTNDGGYDMVTQGRGALDDMLHPFMQNQVWTITWTSKK